MVDSGTVLLISALLGLCIFAVVSLTRPVLGLAVMVALIPAEEVTTVAGNRTLVWVLGLIVFVTWLARSLQPGTRQRFALGPSFSAFLLVGWSFMSVIWATSQGRAFGLTMTLSQLVGFFLLLQVMTRTLVEFRVLVWAYLSSSALIGLAAILEQVSLAMPRAAISGVQNPNNFARALCVALLMAPFAWGSARRTATRRLVVLHVVVLVCAIVLSGSRGALVALATTWLLTWVVSKGKLMRTRSVVGFVVPIFGTLFWLSGKGVLADTWFERLQTIGSIRLSGGLGGRMYIWRVGWEMIKAHPILGVGMGNFPVRVGEFISSAGMSAQRAVFPGRGAHSTYIAVFSELGVIGLLVFFSLLWEVLRPLLRFRRSDPALVGFALASFVFFGGITSTMYVKKSFWFALGTASAAGTLAVRKDRMVRRQQLSGPARPGL